MREGGEGYNGAKGGGQVVSVKGVGKRCRDLLPWSLGEGWQSPIEPHQKQCQGQPTGHW